MGLYLTHRGRLHFGSGSACSESWGAGCVCTSAELKVPTSALATGKTQLPVGSKV